MSGPTTVIFTGDPLTLLLSAAAIRAAEAVQTGYQQAALLHDQHAAQRDDNRARLAEANAAGEQARREQIELAEQRHARLCELAAPYGAGAALQAAKPARPVDSDLPAQVAYIEQLQAICRDLEDGLLAALGDNSEEHEAGLSPERIAALQNEATPARAPTAAIRLLARAAALGPLPAEVERLAKELATASSTERRELLELELRRAIQQFEEDAARQASALVLEQTLKDLGYQVDGVIDTLFVEGGLVHFRRPGWGDYQVRLRLDAKAKSANFNIVRAIDAGNNERSVLDHIAEDRWCSEFPALLQALAKRGLHLDVTRRLAAGELPVQLVDRAKLPSFASEEDAAPRNKPLQKEIR
jgi:hypothetical protein